MKSKDYYLKQNQEMLGKNKRILGSYNNTNQFEDYTHRGLGAFYNNNIVEHYVPATEAFQTDISRLKELAPVFAETRKNEGAGQKNTGATGIFDAPWYEHLPRKDIMVGSVSNGDYGTTYGHSERVGYNDTITRLINEQYSGQKLLAPIDRARTKSSADVLNWLTNNPKEYQDLLQHNNHIVNEWSEYPACATGEKTGGACRDWLAKAFPDGSHVGYTVNGWGNNARGEAIEGLQKAYTTHNEQKPKPVFDIRNSKQSSQMPSFSGFSQQPSMMQSYPFQQLPQGFGFNSRVNHIPQQITQKPKESPNVTGLELQQIHDDMMKLRGMFPSGYFDKPQTDKVRNLIQEEREQKEQEVLAKQRQQERAALEQQLASLRSDLDGADQWSRPMILFQIDYIQNQLGRAKYAQGGHVTKDKLYTRQDTVKLQEVRRNKQNAKIQKLMSQLSDMLHLMNRDYSRG